MTVKERLIERVKTLSEDDAAWFLKQIERDRPGRNDAVPAPSGLVALDARLARIAEYAPAELDRFPPDFPENLDRHLYGQEE